MLTNQAGQERRTGPCHEFGMSLVEIMVAMGTFATVLVMITGTLITSEQVRRFSEEKSLAHKALDNELARLQSLGLQGVLDEIATLGGATEFTVPIPGIDRAATGPSGRIAPLTDETLTDTDIGLPLGMPRDLDGDGLSTNFDTSATATLLPLLAWATWTGVAGTQTIRTVVVLHRPKVN